MVYEGFLRDSGLVWLKEYPRYLEAIEYRLGKVAQMGDRDEAHTRTLAHYWQQYRHLSSGAKSRNMSELRSLRWMIEELRVSLFAQGLGTRVPVSPKRLDKLVDKLR